MCGFSLQAHRQGQACNSSKAQRKAGLGQAKPGFFVCAFGPRGNTVSYWTSPSFPPSLASRGGVLRVQSHLCLLKMDFLPGFFSPTLRPISSRAFSSSSCCWMWPSSLPSCFPRDSEPAAGLRRSFSLMTYEGQGERIQREPSSNPASQAPREKFRHYARFFVSNKYPSE